SRDPFASRCAPATASCASRSQRQAGRASPPRRPMPSSRHCASACPRCTATLRGCRSAAAATTASSHSRFRMATTTAVIAEDEEVLRGELREMLATQWPELDVVAEVGDGGAACRAVEELAPSIVFLDIEMPGASGLEV